MKARILTRKKIKASSSQSAMKIIKTKYPRAKLITYKFDENFTYKDKENWDYNNRTMTVVFIDDSMRCWE